MLGTCYATLPQKDMEAAKNFYGETLGLEVLEETPGDSGVIYQSGSGKIFVYVSEHAGTNKATAASWDVDDVPSTVEALKGKGVTFEHYDNLPGVTRDGDIHSMGEEFQGAWFKDPAGNILSIANVPQ